MWQRLPQLCITSSIITAAPECDVIGVESDLTLNAFKDEVVDEDEEQEWSKH